MRKYPGIRELCIKGRSAVLAAVLSSIPGRFPLHPSLVFPHREFQDMAGGAVWVKLASGSKVRRDDSWRTDTAGL